MTAVVGARGDFIDNQGPVRQHKKFNAQHTDVVQLLCHRFGGGDGLLGQGIWHVASKHLGHGQDAVAVQIALHGQVHHRAIAATRHDDRAFAGQRQHFFQHTRHAS